MLVMVSAAKIEPHRQIQMCNTDRVKADCDKASIPEFSEKAISGSFNWVIEHWLFRRSSRRSSVFPLFLQTLL
jgi:hypothetical protein